MPTSMAVPVCGGWRSPSSPAILPRSPMCLSEDFSGGGAFVGDRGWSWLDGDAFPSEPISIHHLSPGDLIGWGSLGGGSRRIPIALPGPPPGRDRERLWPGAPQLRGDAVAAAWFFRGSGRLLDSTLGRAYRGAAHPPP